ncbi:hypothetical protein HNR21_002228 [Actinomadura cellulosilytica]|uniref:Uncharacterized protein n=1 Tax=Thermomonospora cellulosilytica TaxID=1411118 RepID=A0A7W3R859_9ACTN|nr:hypothetical protein [Thermomonospora cellulosilytica]
MRTISSSNANVVDPPQTGHGVPRRENDHRKQHPFPPAVRSAGFTSADDRQSSQSA